MQKLTREEQETHISIDAIEEFAIVDTSIPKDITKLKKCGWEVLQENKYPDGTICNVIFKAPRKAISFRDVSKLEWSEERKRQASEIGKKFVVNGIGIHAKKANNTSR